MRTTEISKPEKRVMTLDGYCGKPVGSFLVYLEEEKQEARMLEEKRRRRIQAAREKGLR